MLNKIESWLMQLTRWSLILMLAAMAFIIFANVLLRYTTSQSIEWAEEVARYLMVWLTFIGAGPVLRYGGHIAVDNLQDALPKKMAILIRIFIAILIFGFFGFMIYFGALYVERAHFQMTPTTQISMGWVYASIPVGGLILMINWLFIVRDYVINRQFASDEHFDANASASL